MGQATSATQPVISWRNISGPYQASLAWKKARLADQSLDQKPDHASRIWRRFIRCPPPEFPLPPTSPAYSRARNCDRARRALLPPATGQKDSAVLLIWAAANWRLGHLHGRRSSTGTRVVVYRESHRSSPPPGTTSRRLSLRSDRSGFIRPVIGLTEIPQGSADRVCVRYSQRTPLSPFAAGGGTARLFLSGHLSTHSHKALAPEASLMVCMGNRLLRLFTSNCARWFEN